MNDRKKCFKVVRLDGRSVWCPEPIRWHGLRVVPGRPPYRVLSCDDHVDLLVDCFPVSGGGMRTVPRDPRGRESDVGTEAHWAIR